MINPHKSRGLKSAPRKAGAPETKRASVRFDVKALADDGSFEGYGSVFNVVDTYADVVAPGAYLASLEAHKAGGTTPKMLWQHDANRPIGTWTEFREDEHGLLCKGRLILDVAQAKEAHALMKAGAVDALSIGFSAAEWDYDDPAGYSSKFGVPMVGYSNNGKVRVLKQIDLWEVSVVTFPACEPARIDPASVKAVAHLDLTPIARAIERRGAALQKLVSA